jgi:D-3-phosphoglycerate dehydrogenase
VKTATQLKSSSQSREAPCVFVGRAACYDATSNRLISPEHFVMSRFKVLLTDYAWADVEIERRTLAEIDAELIVAPQDRQDAASLAELARQHRVAAIMTNWAKVPQAVIEASPQCRIVSRLGIGLDNIDVAWCSSRGIPVTNIPDYCLIEVAEHALALILALSRKVAFYHHESKQGRYQLQAGPVLRRIEGQTLGIVGLGNIGRKLAEKARGLGLLMVATSRKQTPMLGVEYVTLDELLARSDYVSLHVPLVPATRHMIGAAQLSQLKPSAYLINTARGGLIDQTALAAALESGRLAGAALDVQDPEPPDLSQPPFNDPRVIVTPHAAFVSQESLANLRLRVARQVATRLTGGTPEHVVNAVV